MLGGLLILAATIGLLVNLTLPWVAYDSSRSGILGQLPRDEPANATADSLGRTQLASLFDGPGLGYHRSLLEWPIYAFTGTILVGLALVMLEQAPKRLQGSKTVIRQTAVVFAGLSGFALALTGTRWVGIELNTLFDAEFDYIDLLVVPYANLLLGSAILGLSLWVLHVTTAIPRSVPSVFFGIGPRGAIAVSGLGLLLLPLLPYARFPDGFAGEGEMAMLGALGSGSTRAAGRSLMYARYALWGLLVTVTAARLTAGTAAETPSGRRSAVLRVTALLQILGLLALTYYTVLSYTLVPRMAKVSGPGYNQILPLTFLGVATSYVAYWARARRRILARPDEADEEPARPQTPSLHTVWDQEQVGQSGGDWALEHRLSVAAVRQGELMLLRSFRQVLDDMAPPPSWRKAEGDGQATRGRKEEFGWKSMVLILLLKTRYRMTYREISNLLRSTPEICHVLELPRAPSHGIIQQSANRISEEWLEELNRRLASATTPGAPKAA